MKLKVLLRTVAACATSSLIAGSLMAAQVDSSSPGISSGDTNSLGSSPRSGSSWGTSRSGSSLSATSRMGPERLSQLMSATVKDQEGNAVGQISDFVVQPNSGRIQFAIISLSDQNGKLTAVPFTLIRSGSEANTCTLNCSKDKLAGSQTFDSSSWPDFTQPSTSQQIYSYFGVRPRFGAGGRVPTGGNESGSSSGQPEESNPGSQNPANPPPPQH